MEKFNKLSRAEMRNVTGGNNPLPCFLVCIEDVTGRKAYSFEPDCREDSGEAACLFGGTVSKCTCTN